MKNKSIKHGSNNDNWETPKYIYDPLNNEFHFDFDPCPLNSTFDGLSISWGERNFINPPYSRKLKEKFIKKAYEESKKGKLCVMLLPVSTSTNIFHDIIKPNAEIRFIRGRIRFKGVNTKGEYTTKNCGQLDSMFVIFKLNKDIIDYSDKTLISEQMDLEEFY